MKRMTFADLRLHWFVERGAKLSPPAILLLSAALLVIAAVADWFVGHISLGVLYFTCSLFAAALVSTRVRESNRPIAFFSRSRPARTERDWACFLREPLCEATGVICDSNRT